MVAAGSSRGGSDAGFTGIESFEAKRRSRLSGVNVGEMRNQGSDIASKASTKSGKASHDSPRTQNSKKSGMGTMVKELADLLVENVDHTNRIHKMCASLDQIIDIKQAEQEATHRSREFVSNLKKSIVDYSSPRFLPKGGLHTKRKIVPDVLRLESSKSGGMPVESVSSVRKQPSKERMQDTNSVDKVASLDHHSRSDHPPQHSAGQRRSALPKIDSAKVAQQPDKLSDRPPVRRFGGEFKLAQLGVDTSGPGLQPKSRGTSQGGVHVEVLQTTRPSMLAQRHRMQKERREGRAEDENFLSPKSKMPGATGEMLMTQTMLGFDYKAQMGIRDGEIWRYTPPGRPRPSSNHSYQYPLI